MTRQNFLSIDFFVAATEEEARKSIDTLLQHAPHITLLQEKQLLKSMRFLYEQTEKVVQYYVDVSILPVDSAYVRFSLHGSYTNGHAFHADPDLENALYHFEQLTHSALANDFSTACPIHTIKPRPKKLFSFFSMLFPNYS